MHLGRGFQVLRNSAAHTQKNRPALRFRRPGLLASGACRGHPPVV